MSCQNNNQEENKEMQVENSSLLYCGHPFTTKKELIKMVLMLQ
jgi:hypothetical protein